MNYGKNLVIAALVALVSVFPEPAIAHEYYDQDTLNNEILSLRNKIYNLQSEIDDLKKETESIRKLKSNISSLQSEVYDLKKEIESIRGDGYSGYSSYGGNPSIQSLDRKMKEICDALVRTGALQYGSCR